MRFKLDNLQLFVESTSETGFVGITFDSNITKVVVKAGDNTNEYTTSSDHAKIAYTSSTAEVTVTLKDGYVLDSVTSSGAISNKTDNSFTWVFTDDSSFHNVVLTSKLVTNRISIDLTTLTGWDNVTAGEHQISVIAKATGYLNSAKSTPIIFTKASAKVLLEKGTYIIKPEPYFNLTTNETVSGKMYTLTANDTYGEQTSFDSISLVKKEPGGLGSISILNSTDLTIVSCGGSEWKYLNTDGEEFILSENTQTTLKIRTIVFETNQYVSQEFYNWVTTQGNFTKEGEQEKYRLIVGDSYIEANINGTKINEYPYILKDNDIILLENTSDASSTTRGIMLSYIENNVQTLIHTSSGISSGTISNSDVFVSRDNQNSTTIYDFTLTFKQQESSGETWVLNDNLSSAGALEKTEINFTSNNTQYTALQYKRGTLGYYTADGSLVDIADPEIDNTSWTNNAYKTITFETAPTGDLLTWLQANGTKQGGSSVSKNWKFNGTSAFAPQKTYSKYVYMPGESYNDTTFVANFDYIYYADDWSYITFGSAGFWDISQNQYGKNGGNILKFNTEPSGELLAFLQAHAQPINYTE